MNAPSPQPLVQHAATQGVEKCRICGVRLDADEDDDFALELCCSCKSRPEARRLGVPVSVAQKQSACNTHAPKSARLFTDAEKSMIRKLNGLMPGQQLLQILNERLAFDLGPDALPYTMDMLHAEIMGMSPAAPAGGHDWASLRKLLAQARRTGVLGAINTQVIDDFAVVFQLSPKQVLALKDILLQADL